MFASAWIVSWRLEGLFSTRPIDLR